MSLDSYHLELVNVVMNLFCIGVILFLALKARTLYFAIRTQLTSIGDAARQVRELIRQNDEILAENRRLWASYQAAALDAEAQRVRFLEDKARERDAPASDAAAGGDG